MLLLHILTFWKCYRLYQQRQGSKHASSDYLLLQSWRRNPLPSRRCVHTAITPSPPCQPSSSNSPTVTPAGETQGHSQPESVGPPGGRRSCRFTRSNHLHQNASSQCMRKWWPFFNGCALRIFYNIPHFCVGCQPSWHTPHLTEAHLKRSNSKNNVSNHCINTLFTMRTMHLYILNLKSIYIII